MRKQQSRSVQGLSTVRPGLSRSCLSAGLGLICTLIPNQASATNAPQHQAAFAGHPLGISPHTAGAGHINSQWTAFPVHGSHLSNTQTNVHSIFTLPNTAGSLNLGSSQPSFLLSGLTDVQTLTINVGGKSEVVNLSTKLTGAELVAADQMLSGGHQTLTINASGVATGGVFNLSNQSLSVLDSSITSLNALSVPHNVRVVDSLTNLQLSGDLINSGRIVIQPASGSSSTLQASDIINNAGASISTASSSGASSGVNLVAANQLVNAGSITVAHNLNISAPSVVNAGTLKSTTGNINFSAANSLAVNNTTGTISALQGNINGSTAAANGSLNILGGNLLSNQLNLSAGTGDVNVNVDNVTGLVNVNACSAHINATTADLKLGAMNVSGDPSYYNQGNITITTAMAPTNGQDLAIVASGNIICDGGSLNTSNNAGAGGALTLIAGANFTTSDSSTSGTNNTTTTLNLTAGPGSGGGSLTGGLIDLAGGHGGTSPITAITTAGAGADAGAITMVAYAGKGMGSGTVTLPQALTLSSATVGNGSSGSIVIEGGATKGTAVSVGNIDTSKGAMGQGIIELAATAPTLMGPMTIKNGTITSGSFGGLIVPNNANIVAANLTTGGGLVLVDTKGAINFNNIDTSGEAGVAVQTFAGTSGGAAGIVALLAGGNITGNNIYAYGGGGGGGGIDATHNGTNGGAGGDGAPITLTSSLGTVTIKGTINNSGGGGGGGGGAGYNGTVGNFGTGGTGGAAGNITITTLKSLAVGGGIFSADGGAGGNGGSVNGANQAGSGGGGGGSYAGGGGGGASGNDQSGDLVAGGGGGGGIYGGGGGSGAVLGGFADTGGNGGGFQTPGAGGAGFSSTLNGSTGTKFAGGNGFAPVVASGTGLGGSLGLAGTGGQGAAGAAGAGESGVNVIHGGTLTGGTLTMKNAVGSVGSQKTPLVTLVGTLDATYATLTAVPKNSFYINDLGPVSATFFAFGNVSIQAAGDLTVTSTGGLGQNVTLTTAPGSNGNITLNGMVGGGNATLQADGTGGIATAAGQVMLVNNATLTGNTVGSFANPFALGNINTTVSVNTTSDTYLGAKYNLTLDKSSSAMGNVSISAGDNLTVLGAVTSPSVASLKAGGNLLLEANVSGTNQTVLIATGKGDITDKGVSINTSVLDLGFDAGTVGTVKSPFLTGAPTVNVLGNATDLNSTRVYITDNNTGATSIENLGNPGFSFNVISSASTLTTKSGQYTIFNVSNVSKTGNIVFVGPGGNDGNSSISTVGGNVTQTAGSLNTFSLVFKSTSGSFGSSGNPIDLVSTNSGNLSQVTFNTGKTATINVNDTSALEVLGSSAGGFNLTALQTTILGPITATGAGMAGSIAILDTGTALLSQQPGAVLTGNSVSLTNTGTGNIQSSAAIKAATVSINSMGGNVLIAGAIGTGKGAVSVNAFGPITRTSSAELLSGTSVSITGASIGAPLAPINVASPGLTLFSSADALVNVSGNTLLGTGTIVGNLTLTSTGSLTEASSTTFFVGSNAAITAKSFDQLSGAAIGAFGTVSITTSGMGNAIELSGSSIGSGHALTLVTNAKATITVTAGTTVSGNGITLQTGSLQNAGTIQPITTSALSFTNATGNLTINNTGAITAPLSLTLSSGGNLMIVDNSGGIASFQSAASNSITINATGALTLPNLPSNSLLVAPDSSNNGGTISLNAGSIVYPQGGLFFQAHVSNAAAGNGGTLSVIITGKQNVTLASSPGWGFSADASTMGGTGGNVTISTGGALSVTNGAIDNTTMTAGDVGGATTLKSGGNIQLIGPVDSSQGNPGVLPGAVTIVANGKTPFILDPTLVFNSKTNGGIIIAGSTVQITNPSGVNINSGGMITANNSLRVTTSEFTNNGALTGAATTTTATITNPTGNLTISGNGTWQLNPTNLTSFTLNAGGNLNTGNLFNSVAIDSQDIRLAATGILTLGTGSIQTAQNVKGILILEAKSLAYSIAVPAPLVLDASGGAATTVGGAVGLLLTGTAPLTLSSSGAGNVNIIVSPGSAGATAGGLVDVTTGGNLTVNLSGMQTNNNALAINSLVNLQSGASLLVNGWNANVIGAQGTLQVSDNTSKAFIIGAPITSGIVTATQIVGATLSVTNTGGDVSIGGLDFLKGPMGTNIVSITAGKNIVGVPGVESVYGGIVNLTSYAGSIGIGTKGVPSNALGVFTQTLTANAAKGSVYIDQNFGGAITVGGSSASVFDLQNIGSLTVTGAINSPQVIIATTANGSITVANSIGNGKGTVSLTAGPTSSLGITQTGGIINATALSLSAINVSNLQTNLGQLTANVTGNLTVNNTSKVLTIGSGGLVDGGGDATLTTSGALIDAGPAVASVGTLTYNAGGAITINSKLSGQSVSLNAGNGGAITENKGGQISFINATMTSDTGDINSTKGVLNVSNLVLSTAGNVNLNDSVSAGPITIAPISLPVKSFNLVASTDSSSTVFLNSISTSNGSISVDVNAGFLSLLAGTNLHASSTTAGVGNVNLFIGTPPKPPVVGSQPMNILENFSGKGQIYYNNGSAINATAVSTLNAFGRNINISGPGTNTILLNGVTITADPPPSTATPTAAAGPVLINPVHLPPLFSSAPATPSLSSSSVIGMVSGALFNTASVNAMPMPQINWSASIINPALIQLNGPRPDTSTGALEKAATGTFTGAQETAANAGVLDLASFESIDSTKDASTDLSARTNYLSHGQKAIIDDAHGDVEHHVSRVLGDEALLIAPDSDTTIMSRYGTVELKKKCLALIVSTEQGLTVFNLDDNHSGSVVAHIGSERIALEPGRHLTVARSNVSDFAAVNPAQLIAHRRMQTGEANGFKTFKSEFHLLSAISGLGQLRELVGSVDHQKQITAKHMLKTAAILDGFAQGSSEQFELYSKNLVTAMNR
jgi:hypothetical protein